MLSLVTLFLVMISPLAVQSSTVDQSDPAKEFRVAEVERILGEWREPSTRSLEDWVLLVGANEPQLSREARTRVVDAGAAAVPALISALRDRSDGVLVRRLCEALYWIGPAAFEAGPALEELLTVRPPDDGDRAFVAAALATVDPFRGAIAIPDLERCVLDPSWRSWVRLMCLHPLLELSGPDSAPTMITLLGDDDADLRAEAARALRTGPADRVRRPLSEALRDPVLEVRVRAASSLLTAVPEPPATTVTTLLEGVCQDNSANAELVADTLEESPGNVLGGAEEPLVGFLRGNDERCRTWAAIALGRVNPHRVLPALGMLRGALTSDNVTLRHAAARTLASMGYAAREALPDLESAARTDPMLDSHVRLLASAPELLERCRFDDLRPVAVFRRAGVDVAYLLGPGGTVWEIGPGARLLDGTVERVDAGRLYFRGQRVTEDLSLQARQAQAQLFPDGDPLPLEFDPEYTGEPVSINFDADVTSFLSLVAQLSGLNIVAEAGTSGRVSIAARDAPWDWVVDHGLADSGFGSRLDHLYLRVAPSEQADDLRLLSSQEPAGQLVNLAVIGDDIDLLISVLEEVSGLEIDLPPGPHEPVTVFVREVPWDQLLELLVLSRGWTYRIEGARVVVEYPDSDP